MLTMNGRVDRLIGVESSCASCPNDDRCAGGRKSHRTGHLRYLYAVLGLILVQCLRSLPVASGQIRCPGASECLCYFPFASPVYATQQRGMTCDGIQQAQDVNALLRRTSQLQFTRDLYTLKIDRFISTTQIDSNVFASFYELREIELSNMPIATLQPSAFSNLTNLISLSLKNLQPPVGSLGVLNISSLLSGFALRILDVTGSKVEGFASGSFVGKPVHTLLLSGASFTSIPYDMLGHVTTISLSGNRWQCNACICPLVSSANKATWTDKATTFCTPGPAGNVPSSRLSNLASCGCGVLGGVLSQPTNATNPLLGGCSDAGCHACPALSQPVVLDCSIPPQTQHSCVVTNTSIQYTCQGDGATTTVPPPPDNAPPSSADSLARKIREFLTSPPGIATICVAAAVIVGTTLLVCCDIRRRRTKRRRSQDTRKLLHQLRTQSSQEELGNGQSLQFTFPDFGGSNDGTNVGSHQPKSVMAGLSRSFSTLGGDQPNEDEFDAMNYFKQMVAAQELSEDDAPPSQPQPQVQPRLQRSLRPGSQLSRTSLRDQPIREVDEKEEEDNDDGMTPTLI